MFPGFWFADNRPVVSLKAADTSACSVAVPVRTWSRDQMAGQQLYSGDQEPDPVCDRVPSVCSLMSRHIHFSYCL